MNLLGIDLGTSAVKVTLYNEGGTPLATSSATYPMSQPENGWAEQNPLDWWEATKCGICAVLASHPAGGERMAVGLSGQMHGLVLLGGDGALLRPAILWCDQRTAAECEWMREKVGEKRLIELSANPAMTGFTAAKILWVKHHQPQIYAACRHILLPKDYLRYRLTGEFATDVSDASGMQLMDVGRRCWSEELLSDFGIDRHLLADLYESQELTGVVSAAAAEETGLPAGSPVAAGAGDNAAAAIGAGIISGGNAFCTVGTSAVIYTVTDELKLDLGGRVHSLCASVPSKWTVMSCTQSAGLSLRWLRDTVCAGEVRLARETGQDPYDLMTEAAASVPVGSDRLLFLPYLMGERSPHPDPDCRGAFFGLSARHKRENLIRAVMEGVAFSQRECLDVFGEMGVPLNRVILCGGGASSALWRQMFCDLFGCPVGTLLAEEGGTLGAALLAGVAAGVYSGIDEACGTAVGYQAPVSPSAEAAEYLPYYRLYRSLYPRLKAAFSELAEI